MTQNIDDFLAGPQRDDADAELYFMEQEWLADQAEQEMQARLDADAEAEWFAERGFIDFPEPEPAPKNWTSALARAARRG